MVTGPFSTSFESDVQGVARQKHAYRQTPPFVKPLPYRVGQYGGTFLDYNTNVVSGTIDRRFYGTPYFIATQWGEYPGQQDAYRKAYNRFLSKAREGGASLGTAMVEARESFSMIHARTLTILNSFRAIRRGDVGSLIRELKLVDERAAKARTVFKSRGNQLRNGASHYLEYIFGWKPVVQDIADAISVLQSDYPHSVFTGRGSERVVGSSFEATPWGYVRSEQQTRTRIQIRAHVAISNPNLALANQLGFVNPAAIAYEVIPGSFLLNWFVPIGRFLESWTDWVGYSLSDIAVTRSSSAERTWEQINPGNLHGRINDWGRGMERSLKSDLYPPDMRWFRLPGASAAKDKAASVVALAVQAFSPRK